MVCRLIFGFCALFLSLQPGEGAVKEVDDSLNRQRYVTTSDGVVVDNNQNSLTAGTRGPVLLGDVTLLDKLMHFDRERIPERVVHAKGTGAFGVFQVTNDITKYSKAKVFSNVGKRTPIFVRFSTVGGPRGSADTVRDVRGFSIKFYTEDGNWDMVGNNTPIFFIRDGMKFPDFAHSQKPSPGRELFDVDQFWDFLSLTPESLHQVTILFSDRGIPDGFRFMDGFSSHTFKMVNADNEAFFVKMHFKTRQGIKNLSNEEAARLAAEDPDYSRRDLYDALDRGDFPSWDFYIQVLTPEEAENFPFDVLDVTKVWPHSLAPLIPVGRMTVTDPPQNFFAEVEQAAFAPSHLVPGIEASNDKLLQGRLFSYADTHNHRLGSNSHQIPVNCPYRSLSALGQGADYYVRDGEAAASGNLGSLPNYEPNSAGPRGTNAYVEGREQPPNEYVSGPVGRFEFDTEDDFVQVGVLYRDVMNEDQRTLLVNNIVGSLSNARADIQRRMVELFNKADREYGARVARGLERARYQ